MMGNKTVKSWKEELLRKGKTVAEIWEMEREIERMRKGESALDQEERRRLERLEKAERKAIDKAIREVEREIARLEKLKKELGRMRP